MQMETSYSVKFFTGEWYIPNTLDWEYAKINAVSLSVSKDVLYY